MHNPTPVYFEAQFDGAGAKVVISSAHEAVIHSLSGLSILRSSHSTLSHTEV